MQIINRRHFLKTTAAAIAALILPKSLLAKTLNKPFHFIHVDSQNSFAVADPVSWSLENARQPG